MKTPLLKVASEDAKNVDEYIGASPSSYRSASPRTSQRSAYQSGGRSVRAPSIDQLDRILNTRWHRFILRWFGGDSEESPPARRKQWSQCCRVLPSKFILHVVLLVLTTSTVFVANTEGARYIRTSKMAWTHLLMPEFAKDG